MRILIIVVGVYATWFAAVQIGWLGFVMSVVTTIIVFGWWNRSERETALAVKKQSELRFHEIRSIEALDFAKCDRQFLGDERQIFVYEHHNDLIAEVSARWPNLHRDSVLFLRHRQGAVAVIDPKGWPSDRPNSLVSRVLEYQTTYAEPESRNSLKFIPTSDSARQVEADHRNALQVEVETRVAERSHKLAERKRSDVGSEAIGVYLIVARNQRSCKVGISQDPTKRLKELQTGSSSVLSINRIFWMRNRTEAHALESGTHRELGRRGLQRTGEWFPVAPEIATDALSVTYDLLLERGIVDKEIVKISEGATDNELSVLLAKSLPWKLSKRSNLTAGLDGKRVTVFRRKGVWCWVVDGEFALRKFESALEAQIDCVQRFAPDRDRSLAMILGQTAPPR